MKRKLLIFIFSALLFFVLVVVVSNIWVNSAARGRLYDKTTPVPPGRTVVLLGTSPKSRFGGRNMYYQYRIDAAVDLYKRHPYDRIILSGAKVQGYDEPRMMKRDLVKRGIPEHIVEMDGQGFRTLNSMQNVKDKYRTDSVIIISQRWHNQRAIFLARHLGIDAVGYDARDVFVSYAIIIHLRELLARVKACGEVVTKRG